VIVGDRIISVNGRSLEPEASVAFLHEQVATGKPVKLEIRRADGTIMLTISPHNGSSSPG
jgi:C-terminal processing protease CtpA/Prc